MLKNHPDAKIALSYQNDDSGKDYVKGFEDGLGPDDAKQIVVRNHLRADRPDRRLADRHAEDRPAPTCCFMHADPEARRRRRSARAYELELAAPR